tara:strand:+ start:659 stop:2380 length:1722 start_codon:yes stop_codon:yes gene_type:complete
MNRHQRRKLKKDKQDSQPFQQDLVKIIKIHSDKNYDLAEKEYKKLLAKIPNDYETIRHLGILYFDTNRIEEAFNHFQKAIQINPSRCEAYNNIGFIHFKNRNLELAQKCLHKSYDINPKYIPVLNNLTGLYVTYQDPVTALKFAKKAINVDPQNPISNSQYAKALIQNGRLNEAIIILENLYKTHPLPFFRMDLATAYRENGEMEKSDQIVREEFKENYKNLDIFGLYAINKSNTLSEEHIKYYEDMISLDAKDDKTLKRNQIKLCETFYIYYKNNKNIEKSSEYLLKMNKLQFSLEPYDLNLEKTFFTTIKEIFSNDLDAPINIKKNIVPIFICGMPRSGTTLCEQILSSHSNVTGAGELNFLANLTGIGTSVQVKKEILDQFKSNIFEKDFLLNIRKKYIAALIERRENNNQYICDKMPHNFVFIGLIRSIFPEAKIIYCKRDPIDNCFSLYAHKFLEMSHQYSYDQKTLAQYYVLHNDLMNFWIEKYKENIFVLDNEELINNQERVSRDIVDFCDLDWEKSCLNFHETKRQVRTASIDQVRKPLNKNSIGAWKQYEKSLPDLVNQLNKVK